MTPVNTLRRSSDRLALTGGLLTGMHKITPDHLDRRALVYVRQSGDQQVLDHQESTRLQYALVDQAVTLGWPRDRILVIDDDLGCSASIPDIRAGFECVMAEVTLGQVGLVVGIEMNRLARTNQEWYRLFDYCALVNTLLADRDGVYDAKDINDRLLLGLKGIMSEMEVHTLRSRLGGALLNKAARGEMFIAVPRGYLILPDGSVDLDPDEQVQAAVRLVFEKFDELGTANGVSVYFRQHQIRLPIRPHTGPNRGSLQWQEASSASIRCMLQNPLYAGAYVFGRRRLVHRVDGTQTTRLVPQEEWKVFLPDTLPAYISWEKYEKNRQRLRQNRPGKDTPGTPRQGLALLGGLVVCGRCGRKLQVHYDGRGTYDVFYHCGRAVQEGRVPSCQGIKACVLDELVSSQVLRALEPAALELSLAAAADVQRERRRLDEQRRKQCERAAYEAARIERQYAAVEPENRLVARTLERRWEEALREQRRVAEEYARFAAQHPVPPSDEEYAAIRRLAEDVPALWHSDEMKPAERSAVVRCLLERVEVAVQGQSEWVDVTLHWAGGFVSQHEVIRPVSHYTQLRDYDRLMERVRQLHQAGKSLSEISDHLYIEGFRPARRERFTPAMVRQLWRRIRDEELGPQEWRLSSLSRRLQVSETRLRDWLRRGWLGGRKVGRTWIAVADEPELDRLCALSAYQTEHGRFHPYPSELIMPSGRC